ncbi:MAG: hypothetical protein J5879_00575 [Clostridia bacterium]|nr:hypothetical protein [Clostridia bacterium]
MNNDYASLKNNKKKGSVVWLVIAILIILEFCAVSMLFAQIRSFSAIPQRNFISLTEETENTKLTISEKASAYVRSTTPLAQVIGGGKVSAATIGALNNAQLLTAAITGTGFSVYDKDKVWSTQTDVEIFKIAYENDELVTTVNSFNNTDKVIAPGTSNDYSFTLKNSGTVSLDYILQVDAFFEGTDYIIPVEAKMYDYKGKYLAGSSDTWVPVKELDTIEESGVLAAGKIADYTLKWQWPFERFDGDGLDANDEYDTMLGNLAADGEELKLHIIIKTVAEVDENPDEPGGDDNPGTGEGMMIPVIIAVAVIALVAIIVLAVGKRKNNWA